MAHHIYISDPSLLAVWEGFSHVKLALLKPLADAAFLFACQDASYGESLNLEPICCAWREAMRQVQPFAVVTFDLTIPELPISVRWEEDSEYIGAKFTLSGDTLTKLVITLATVNGLRSSSDVLFELTADHFNDRPMLQESFLALRRTLDALNVHFCSKSPDI